MPTPHLANEVLLNIAEQVEDIRTLKSLRLVGKLFAKETSIHEKLFEAIGVDLQNSISVARLKRGPPHEIRPYVRAFVVSSRGDTRDDGSHRESRDTWHYRRHALRSVKFWDDFVAPEMSTDEKNDRGWAGKVLYMPLSAPIRTLVCIPTLERIQIDASRPRGKLNGKYFIFALPLTGIITAEGLSKLPELQITLEKYDDLQLLWPEDPWPGVFVTSMGQRLVRTGRSCLKHLSLTIRGLKPPTDFEYNFPEGLDLFLDMFPELERNTYKFEPDMGRPPYYQINSVQAIDWRSCMLDDFAMAQNLTSARLVNIQASIRISDLLVKMVEECDSLQILFLDNVHYRPDNPAACSVPSPTTDCGHSVMLSSRWDDKHALRDLFDLVRRNRHSASVKITSPFNETTEERQRMESAMDFYIDNYASYLDYSTSPDLEYRRSADDTLDQKFQEHVPFYIT